MTAPLLYTPQAAAKELGVGKTTIYALFATGELPSVKIGSARRVRATDLEAYVAGLTA